MEYSNKYNSFISFLVAISLLLCALPGSSMARPLPQGKFSRFQTHNTSKATIRTVWSKLPKATPVPPSAPAPIGD
ncbi:unnamed protein product [Dovyalis caffra]|uniref:Transmembrane protein n=1 Tax=Dovyalis caffra TaxID=77055 RepID=A0AAV1SF03_9ROSI|nr:unnamed protein product [Dovyalis caffra]